MRINCNTVVVSVFVLVLLSVSFSMGTYSGGSGTSDAPYLITTAEDLDGIQDNTDDYDKYFTLTNNIDMAEYSYIQAPIAGDPVPGDSFDGTAFTGNFNGNGNTISNLSIRGGLCYCGLFGKVGPGGTIENLNLENVVVTEGFNYVGGLCGINNSGTVTGCHTNSSVVGVYSSIGGLCGDNSGNITDSYAAGSTSGLSAGSLCGENSGYIAHCYATGEVTGTSAFSDVGGLCGINNSGIITACYAAGNTTGAGLHACVGGLCGRNYADITGCYAAGNTTGTGTYSCVGGLCGWIDYGSVKNSYAIGSVTGTGFTAGGLCGQNYAGSITNCYAISSVSGNNVAGLCGYQYGSTATVANCFWDVEASGITVGCNFDINSPGTVSGLEGKTTSQMKTKTNYIDAGWDFESIWILPMGQYPQVLLRLAGDVNFDGSVDLSDLSVLSENWLR